MNVQIARLSERSAGPRSLGRSFIRLTLLLLAGCGGSAQQELGGGPEPPSWPELTQLNTEAVTAVGMALEMGGPAEAKRTASQPPFQQAVDNFANTPIPDKYATDEREAAKTQLVESLRAIGEGGDAAAEYEQVKAAYSTLTTP